MKTEDEEQAGTVILRT